jgi:diguanylate cyclase (GGDEF)-like protein
MSAVGPGDAVFRYGGGDFVVIADALPRAAAFALAEHIRRTVASHKNDTTPHVTISIGLAACAEDASDYDGLFACADRRLYMAKKAGRNCVVGESNPDANSPRLVWSG